MMTAGLDARNSRLGNHFRLVSGEPGVGPPIRTPQPASPSTSAQPPLCSRQKNHCPPH